MVWDSDLMSRKLSNQFMRHRDEVFDFLDIAITWTRDVLLVAVGRSDTIVNISRKEEIKGLLDAKSYRESID